MQPSHLKLKEIIWEITSECHNKCSYCGSKEISSIPKDEESIKKIVDEIVKYPPEEINISGGDPLLVSYDTHKYVVEALKKAKVVCKIIVNPDSIVGEKLNILSLYDRVGLSINSSYDWKIPKHLLKKITFITNFNTTNIFNFEAILKSVESYDVNWQIQYTIYKKSNDAQALYNNEEALKYFYKKLDETSYDKITFADNMNDGKCSAGFQSLGILYNGHIVPCLSMRAWANIKEVSYIGLLEEDKNAKNIGISNLQYIWEYCFADYRFVSFKCCKDHCKNKSYSPSIKIKIPDLNKNIPDIFKKPHKQIDIHNMSMVYGVRS